MKNKTIASIISVLVEKLVRAEMSVKILKRQKKELHQELDRIKADLEAEKALSKFNAEAVKAISQVSAMEKSIRHDPIPELSMNVPVYNEKGEVVLRVDIHYDQMKNKVIITERKPDPTENAPNTCKDITF